MISKHYLAGNRIYNMLNFAKGQNYLFHLKVVEFYHCFSFDSKEKTILKIQKFDKEVIHL